MSLIAISVIASAFSLALILIGGGLYEFLVVDPCWPRRPQIIQPDRGGISRKRFWIPVHSIFELLLLAALFMAWPVPEVRFWLAIAFISHAIMRVWSAIDFIPKALAFERAEPETIDEAAARRWSHRSLLRLPLDLATFFSILTAFVVAMRMI